jgi:TonB family protein
MKSLQQSLLIHSSFLFVFLFLYYFSPKENIIETFKVEMIDVTKNNPEKEIKTAQINITKKIPEIKPVIKGKEVFGINRKSILEEESNSSVAVKTGNTLAKEIDEEKLDINDPDELPIPAEEYLITDMPKIINEYKIPYPPKARKFEISGQVIVDILIDQNGIVRDAKLMKGLGFGLDEAALDGVKRYQFSAAKVGAQSVAVKIRYAINFILE